MKACHDTGFISFSKFKEIVESFEDLAYIPISMDIPMPRADPATIYSVIEKGAGFLLESMEGIPKRAVRSIIGKKPLAILTYGDNLEISGNRALAIHTIDENSQPGKTALDIIQNICSTISAYSPDKYTFTGGLTGYCRYELVNDITEGMVKAGSDDGPMVRFMIPGELVVFDHVKNTCTLIAGTLVQKGDNLSEIYNNAVQVLDNLRKNTEVKPENPEFQIITSEKTQLPDNDRSEYEKVVSQAQEYIRAGDIFQVVLSRRFSLPYLGDPFRIYQVLRTINPSPYLYYLDFGDETVIGSSPEMLVKTESREVTTVPIAGTRPRGKTEKDDANLAAELLGDPKERAEHLMLVDLARNDIGRVSEFGSVRVSEFMSVEKFSHVQHITSVVTGELQKELHPIDALRACFPAGTVSGAPKIRAMQIIEELEKEPRGLYSGAVGYLGFNDLMEFAIAIRTVIVKDGIATCQAGAGIVADSIPSREFDETQAKASAMAQAVLSAGGQI